MKKNLVTLAIAGAMLLSTTVCNASIADERIAYDGYETPDGVTIGMGADVLNSVYGKANKVKDFGTKTSYYYAGEYNGGKMLIFTVSNETGCIIKIVATENRT